MKRIWVHLLSLSAAALGIASVTPACVVNDQSIYVRGVLFPSTNRQNGACVYTDDPQQPQLFNGTMDMGVVDAYSVPVLVGNQMIPRADTQNARAESMRVHIQGAVVNVHEPGGASIHEFTTYASGFADPGANNTPDFGLAELTLIDPETRRRLLAQTPDFELRPNVPNPVPSKTLVATFRVFGRTTGGKEVETGDFDFTIRVCNGCLVTFVDSNDDTQRPEDQPNCLKPLAQGGAAGGGTLPCRPGQDEGTPCQLCVGREACNPKLR
ncbi:MAG: hypothetical protein KF819_02810 [Labilithrix sp.]|nr:hypothetical protein [Labilithrix sp.]